jgi:hypothetical protein
MPFSESYERIRHCPELTDAWEPRSSSELVKFDLAFGCKLRIIVMRNRMCADKTLKRAS